MCAIYRMCAICVPIRVLDNALVCAPIRVLDNELICVPYIVCVPYVCQYAY